MQCNGKWMHQLGSFIHLPSMLFRLFILLENVSAILAVNMRDVMQYLCQAWPSKPQTTWRQLASFCKAAACRGLRLTWATVDGHQVGAPAQPLGCEVYRVHHGWLQTNFVLDCWDLAPKNFPTHRETVIQYVQGQTNLNSLHDSLVRSFSSVCQDHDMMTTEELKSWPHKTWMGGTGVKKNPIHKWLNKSQTPTDKNQLSVCGNIVVPAMAHLALHCLASMWQWPVQNKFNFAIHGYRYSIGD